jgi:hypothetical protein
VVAPVLSDLIDAFLYIAEGFMSTSHHLPDDLTLSPILGPVSFEPSGEAYVFLALYQE